MFKYVATYNMIAVFVEPVFFADAEMKIVIKLSLPYHLASYKY